MALLASAALAQPEEPEAQSEPNIPSRLSAPPLATARPLAPELDLLALASRTADGHLWAPHGGSSIELLTIEPLLQKELTDLLKLYQTP